jgi:beta-phosphoglucomutase
MLRVRPAKSAGAGDAAQTVVAPLPGLHYLAAMSQWPAAVLFDFDGVIVNSEPLHFAAFAEVLAEEGITIHEAEYYRELIGFDDTGAFQYVYAKHRRVLDEATFHRVMVRKGQVVAELMRRREFGALPGVIELVRGLARHYPLAICSGARRGEIDTMLQAMGLAEFFPIIVAAEDVAVGKPDPSGYLLTARLVGERAGRAILPGDCLIVEDAPSVIAAVRAAGFKVLAVATSHPAEDLAAANWVLQALVPAEVARVVGGLLVE